MSVSNVIKAHEKIDKCCLSCSRRAYNSDKLTLIGIEVQIFDNRIALDITEADILDSYIAFDMGKLFGIPGIKRLRQLVKQQEYTFCRRQGRLEFADNIGIFIDWSLKFSGVQHEGGNISNRHTSGKI